MRPVRRHSVKGFFYLSPPFRSPPLTSPFHPFPFPPSLPSLLSSPSHHLSPFPPSPPLTCPSPPSLCHSFLHFPSLSSPPLEVGPLNPARGLESAVSSPSGVWGGAPPKSDLVHFSLKIWHVVATIFMICFRINQDTVDLFCIFLGGGGGSYSQTSLAYGPAYNAVIISLHCSKLY